MKIPEWLNTDSTIYQKINDEYKEVLWGLRLVNLEHSWKKYSLSNVTVAVIDSGLEYSHEDFDNTIKSGYNFLHKNIDIGDNLGHGTGVVGVLAAVPNNSIGIAGAAYGAKIIPLKVIDTNGSADIGVVIEALDWCLEQDVDIVNISMGIVDKVIMQRGYTWQSYIKKMQMSIDALSRKGVIVISAIGNSKNSNMDIPACFDKVIAVGAVGINESGELYVPQFNNKGNAETIYAPGEKILTTLVGNTYGFLDGTSLSAAFVTAANVYAKAINPEIDVWKAKEKILKSAGSLYYRGKEYKMLNIDGYISEIEDNKHGKN